MSSTRPCVYFHYHILFVHWLCTTFPFIFYFAFFKKTEQQWSLGLTKCPTANTVLDTVWIRFVKWLKERPGVWAQSPVQVNDSRDKLEEEGESETGWRQQWQGLVTGVPLPGGDGRGFQACWLLQMEMICRGSSAVSQRCKLCLCGGQGVGLENSAHFPSLYGFFYTSLFELCLPSFCLSSTFKASCFIDWKPPFSDPPPLGL